MVRNYFYLAASWALAAQLSAADWPQFRGPHGNGIAATGQLPVSWGPLRGVAWRSEIPGQGWSSPIVVGGKIWVTAAEQTALSNAGQQQRLAEGIYKDYADQFQAHAAVTLYAIEFDLASGKRERTLPLFTVENPPPIHATNSYASPTPISDGERLYCHFGSLGTAAVDLVSGAIIWHKRLVIDEITGPGGSPVLWNDRLVFSCDGADEQYVVALHKLTGETLWKTPRPAIAAADAKQRRAFSTPLAFEWQGRAQIVSPGAQWVVSYDPATGQELWRVNYGDGHATIPRPVFAEGVVYICTGFMKPQLVAIRADGTGDVTETHVLWKYDRQVPDIASPLLWGDQIYFVASLGVATCLESKTGKLIWQQRLAGNYSASPIAADDKLYFTNRDGTTVVIKRGGDYEELSRNQLFGQTQASLAAADGRLILRADRTLYCIEGPVPSSGR